MASRKPIARWRMGDGAVLTLAANFGTEPCPTDLPAALTLIASSGAVDDFAIPPRATLAFLESEAE